MDDILGISLRRFVVTILAILALIFLFIEKPSFEDSRIITIISLLVVVYLSLVVILSLARRSDFIGIGGQVSVECSFGVLMLVYNISAVYAYSKSVSGLTLAALIMNLTVGALFILFSIF